jgi:hypothetical protein
VARIVLGSYMVRYPLGGMLSWVLQYLLGFKQLGHDVYFVEKAGYADACFDPSTKTQGDDCTYGIQVVQTLLARFDLQHHWCFVDAAGRFHGLAREQIEAVLKSMDLFVDMGTHGAWLEEAADAQLCVLIDGEPGFTQMKMEQKLAAGESLPAYDAYYTNGLNVGTESSTAPTAGLHWHHVVNPVATDVFTRHDANVAIDAPFTTVMNWQSHSPLTFKGTTYGQKDVEFAKFLGLPRLTDQVLEVALAGQAPIANLRGAGWRIRNSHEVTATFDAYAAYIAASRGEFSVCKNVFVATNSGWFSDRSAAYLASGRPVVMQDTGFGAHLPCGRGLFAVRQVEEAAAAIDEISGNFDRHVDWAREIAVEHLDARRVLRKLLSDFGIERSHSVQRGD